MPHHLSHHVANDRVSLNAGMTTQISLRSSSIRESPGFQAYVNADLPGPAIANRPPPRHGANS